MGSKAGGGRPFIHPFEPRHLTVREAARLGIIQNLSVVVAVVAGVLVLQETFLFIHAVASALIIAGVVFANYVADPAAG